jgi:hypothetical protein
MTLPEPFLVQRDENKISEPLSSDDRIFHLSVNNFEVEIELGGFSRRAKGLKDGPMATEITTVIFRVTRNEPDLPPVVKPAKDGTIDFTDLQFYLWEKQKDYKGVVEQLFERLSAYFRFQMGHALVNLHPERGQTRFNNPVWRDEAGNILYDHISSFVMDESPSLYMYPNWGITAYKPEDRPSLLSALERQAEIDLYEEILSDARDAAAMGNLRRAVLELAIACEMAIKHVFFIRDSNADAAYSYLEDKGLARARVLDFVDGIALHAFGSSLRIEDRECFQRLDHLFRCRNKIAHRGSLIFRDDQGKELTVDMARLLDWWTAVRKVIDWLKALAG